MIRLTVLYNLTPGEDEETFLRWRLGSHQEENAGLPGVQHTDFGIVKEGWPDSAPAPYRFMTTAEWPDMESFRAAFYDTAYQEKLHTDLHFLDKPVFLISEILAST